MIEEVVKALEDGQWHTFKEIKEKFSLSEAKLHEIIDFLRKFELIYIEEKEEKAKLNASLLNLPA